MKTLENHTLFYDKDCPMCNIYTARFIKTKMLDANGRKINLVLLQCQE
jgi:predicted DCC family thiol-disulfide oxidoreductase YuxK